MEELKRKVCEANKALKENGLVKWTSGNVSLRIPNRNLVIIKPSGVHFEELTADKMVVVDLDGNVIKGDLKPSVDTASHLYVYRHRQDIHSIVHTHSPFATSFAIRGESLPAYATTAANIFGKGVPCSGFAAIGEEEIGEQIVSNIGESPAILLRNHGVFTVGKNVESALKAAVILEEVAEYSHYATLHNPGLASLDNDIIQVSHQYYQTSYGQKNH
ncbi:L-ribulose-5-phosphate 4-epimerase [Rossellomorea oryzaecorticis]|uniref:L-ribulose-5-phosphate 4-epimerase n=1 Tax=Rossellomorea oryzaecorticis TaxID=1396505 RepID=A0ABW8VVY0_9BACI